MCVELISITLFAFVLPLVNRRLDMNPRASLALGLAAAFAWAAADFVVSSLCLSVERCRDGCLLPITFSTSQFRLQFALATPAFFDFRRTFVDLWLLAVVRSALLFGAVFGSTLSVAQRPRTVLGRIRTAATLAHSIGLCAATYSAIKLLAYDEFNPKLNDWSFWLNSGWNAFASVLFCVFWKSFLPRSIERYANVVQPEEEDELEDSGSSIETVTEETVNLIENEVVDNSGNSETLQSNGTVVAVRQPNSKNKKKKKKKDKKSSDDDEDDSIISKGAQKPSLYLLWRLLSYCKNEWPWYLCGFVAICFYSGSNTLIPLYTGRTITSIVLTHSYTELHQSVLMVFLLSLGSAIFGGIRGGAFSYVIAKILRKIRHDLFSSVVKQDIGFFDKVKSGNINSRITSDCQTMSDTIGLNINVFTRNLIMLIGSLIVMLRLSWQLTIITLVITPFITIFSQLYGDFFDKLSKRVQDELARSNEVADEVISSMRTVRSFANESAEVDRYGTHLDRVLRMNVHRSLGYVGYVITNDVFYMFTLVGTLWYGGHLVISGRMQGQDMVSFLLYQLQLGENLASIGYVWTGLMQSVGASRKVFDLIEREPDFDVHDGSHFASTVQGRIEFRNVDFSYPSRPDVQVLNTMSFTVEPGEMVALVGPSGGGKSSCISLLQHFYRPSAGQVLVDGRPVHDYDHRHYHRIVSLVSQEPVLYARSVSDNIAYGLDDCRPPQAEIEMAAKQANADAFIRDQPDGYDTEVGEKGQQLSGGQKQRVAIARSLLRKPKILLLDEATSALDSESEHLVQEAIYRNLEGHTVLLIAHRLSTVEKADRIIVIDQGVVVQQGSHRELVKQDGLYAALVRRQLLGGAMELTGGPPSAAAGASPASGKSSRASRLSTSSGSPSKTMDIRIRRNTDDEMYTPVTGSPHRSISNTPPDQL